MESNKPTTDHFCSICELRSTDRSIPANIWCPICDEYLCERCEEQHSLSRLTKGHKTFPVQQYDNLSSIVKEVNQNCDDHDEIFQFLCPKDQILCCRKCITTTHSQCYGFLGLEEELVSLTSSALRKDVEQALQCLLHNLSNAKRDREGNMKLVIEQKEKYHSDIKKFRTKVNEYLDELERKLVEELNLSIKVHENDMNDVIKEIDSKQNCVTELIDNIKQLEHDGINLKSFLAMRNLKAEAEKMEEEMSSFLKSDKFDKISVEMSISSEAVTSLSKLKTLGTVRVIIKPRTISISTKEQLQCQNAICPVPKLIKSQTDLKLSTKMQAPKGKQGIRVTGCAIAPNGNIYIADFLNKRILTLNTDGLYSRDISFIDSPVFDLTFIDGTKIAMSSGSYREIKIFDTNNHEVTRILKTSGNNYGISSQNGSIIFCVGNQNIHEFNLSDQSLIELDSGKLKNNAYICSAREHIYHTSPSGSTIICRDTSGKILWDFYTEKLKNPRGIAVDRTRKVYVVGETSNNLISISEDGKHFNELLTKEDGLNKPSAISCDMENDVVAICNKDGCLFVYKIQ